MTEAATDKILAELTRGTRHYHDSELRAARCVAQAAVAIAALQAFLQACADRSAQDAELLLSLHDAFLDADDALQAWWPQLERVLSEEIIGSLGRALSECETGILAIEARFGGAERVRFRKIDRAQDEVDGNQ